MAIKYSKDILKLLSDKGFSSYRLRQEKLIGQAAIQKVREGKLLSWHELDTVCRLLHCQPGDLIEYIEEDQPVRE